VAQDLTFRDPRSADTQLENACWRFRLPRMRILLDAHISGRTVGKVLIEDSHNVRALDSEPELEGLSDPEVLELATEEGRVLVTANIRDFEPKLREWAGESRSHAGVILVPSSVRNEAFGFLISCVKETLADTAQEDWVDQVEWIRRA
jgi:predicted nuclease of predicted toxin-antitoxin system